MFVDVIHIALTEAGLAHAGLIGCDEALKAAGCGKIFSEKASGKSTNGRREFDRLMKSLVPGDAVLVLKLDRLARSSRDLHNILHELQEQDCGFVSLGGKLVRHDHGRR